MVAFFDVVLVYEMDFLIGFYSLQTARALALLQKFESIAGVELYLKDKYQRVLLNYGKLVSS